MKGSSICSAAWKPAWGGSPTPWRTNSSKRYRCRNPCGNGVDMPLYAVRHRTVYVYSEPVQLSFNLARLRPRELAGQRVTHFALESEPRIEDVREETDFFGNPTAVFKAAGAHERFEITTHSRVDVSWSGRGGPPESPAWEEVA